MITRPVDRYNLRYTLANEILFHSCRDVQILCVSTIAPVSTGRRNLRNARREIFREVSTVCKIEITGLLDHLFARTNVCDFASLKNMYGAK